MKKPRSMMGISCPTGSHLPMLSDAARACTGLVLEHGAGLYSTPLLARLGCRVVCVEPHPSWREWAAWIYETRVEMLDSYKAVVPRLSDVSLAFIDGPATERGPLLSACLAAGVPTIIVHDTDEGDWAAYGLQPHMFMTTSYTVTHASPGAHRTTRWSRVAPLGVPFDP